MLNGLFPDGVITEVAAPWMWNAELVREEETIIRNAVAKRRREFTAGRTCARNILKQLGLGENLTIGKDQHGAPIWPEGIAGSISHTDGVCIVSICRQEPALSSLGVDVEQDTRLEPALMKLVCDEGERKLCCGSRSNDPYRLAKVIFSAKESVYKCLYPVTGSVLDFQDVHIRLNVSEQTFLVGTNGSLHAGAVEGTCNGRVLFDAGHIYTSCALSAPGKTPYESIMSG